MRQHNVWCVCVAFCVERYVGLNIPQTKFYGKSKQTFYVWRLPLPRKPFPSRDTVKRYSTIQPEATDDNMAHARCVLDNEGYRHTHTIKLFNTTAFQGDNVYANAPHCHVKRTQLLCFSFSATFPFLSCVFAKSDKVTPSSMHAATLLCLLCSRQFSGFSPFFSFFRIDLLWS